jgi:hypothetical protein
MSSQPKARLLSLDALDQRTIAAKAVQEMIASVEADLGGELTTAKRSIVESGALLTAMLRDMGARWLAGEQVDLGLFATLSNAQRRAFETLGFDRAARDVTPTVSEYLAQKTPTEEK